MATVQLQGTQGNVTPAQFAANLAITTKAPAGTTYTYGGTAPTSTPTTTQTMGNVATSPTPKPTTNTIPASQTQPVQTSSNPYIPLSQFNLANYVTDPNKFAQGTQIMNQAGYNANGTPLATSATTAPNATGVANPSSANTGLVGGQTAANPNVTNQGLLNQLASQGVNRNAELAAQAKAIADTAGQRIADIGDVTGRQKTGYLTTGTSPVALGNASVVAQTGAERQQAVASGANMQLQGVAQGLTAQQQAQGALGTATGYSQPTTQFGVLTNPQTGLPISGNVGNAVTMGTNIQSIQDGQAKINAIDQQSGGAKSNLQLAINVAKQLPGMNSNAPIVNAFQQAFGSNFTQSPQYAAFQAQINSIKTAYAAMGIDPGIVDWTNISVDQLNYLAQTLDKNIANVKGGIQYNIDLLKSNLGGTQSVGTSGGSTGGSIWSF